MDQETCGLNLTILVRPHTVRPDSRRILITVFLPIHCAPGSWMNTAVKDAEQSQTKSVRFVKLAVAA